MLVMRLPFFALLAAVSTALAAEAPPEFRFKIETLIEGMPQPLEMQFAPDGRIFFIEIGGKVKVLHPDTKRVVEAGSLAVFTDQENGLLGMALDPGFAQNHWIYLLHSPKDFSGQHLSRFAVNGDTLDMASEKLLLKYEEQRKECCHHAGCVRFGPDGCLYFSAGDNTNPFASDGLAPIDMRPDRSPWDAQKSAANPNDLRGKINRIKPSPEGGYTIPEGNLFPPGTPGTRPEIYVMGCRNPWRFNIDQKTGILYYGDVGNDAGGDSAERGPRGYDLINQVRKPANFGWPMFRGNNRPYAAYDFATKTVGPRFDPAHPVNNSPNNTGRHDLPPAQPAWIYYPYGVSAEFPELGKDGRCACAGPVFHWQAAYEKTGGLPAAFDNCLFIYDWQRPFIKCVRLDENAYRVGFEDFTKAIRVAQGPDDDSGRFQIRRPVDMIVGPDGALYVMDYGETWGANKDSRLSRISYQSGHLAPVAKASAKNAAGREPLTVTLSAEGTKSLENDALTYEWRLQPGDQIVAKTASAQITIPAPGNSRAELRVTDAHGSTGTAYFPLMVGNTAPVVRFESPVDGDFSPPGQPIKFKVAVHDDEDGDSTAKPDEFSIRTLVSAVWEGADGKGGTTEPGLALMKQSDCFNCHAIDTQIVGPPLIKVAEKYRGQAAGAENATVERVLKGSTGVWGQVGMLPHPQHTEDELHLMVRWIYSLEPGKGSPGLIRGLTGEIPAPPADQANVGILEASYTDAGRPPVGSLTGKAIVHLRANRLEAENGDEIHGPQILGAGNAGGKKMLGSIGDGHFVKFAGLHLGGITSATARVSCAGTGGNIQFRADSPTGELIGEVEVKPTGGWETWVEIPVALKTPATASTDLYLVFVKPGVSGGMMNLDWVQLNRQTSVK